MEPMLNCRHLELSLHLKAHTAAAKAQETTFLLVVSGNYICRTQMLLQDRLTKSTLTEAINRGTHSFTSIKRVVLSGRELLPTERRDSWV